MSKLKTLFAALALMAVPFLPTPALAQGGGGGGDAVGSLPNNMAETAGKPGGGGTTDPCNDGSEKAGPGDTVSNNDGVSAGISAGGKGSVRLDPKGGTANCASNVQSKSGTSGLSVSGIDSNDRVNLGGSNTGSVSGDGGVVTLASNSHVTVTNTAPAGSGKNITVYQPGGANTVVGPGSTVTFNT